MEQPEPFKELTPINSTPVSTALEGRNMRELQLDMVFETAIKMEVHLLGASERIADMVIDAIAGGIDAALTTTEGR